MTAQLVSAPMRRTAAQVMALPVRKVVVPQEAPAQAQRALALSVQRAAALAVVTLAQMRQVAATSAQELVLLAQMVAALPVALVSATPVRVSSMLVAPALAVS